MSAGPSKTGNLDSLGIPPPPVNKHAPTPKELQAMQLAKLLKDPSKDVFIPKPPKEKTLRPPKEMMKNVQGSSAGAGSGEFHVYKQNRRREYERIKLMNEKAERDAEQDEFERRKREREEVAEAKTSKNRAKRQKKKARMKNGPAAKGEDGQEVGASTTTSEGPLKKRRLIDGKEMVFRRPGEESDEDDEEDGPRGAGGNIDVDMDQPPNLVGNEGLLESNVRVIEETKIIIHDD